MAKRHASVYILSVLALSGLASALCGSLLPARTYTTADGLPSNRVNRIVRDARGFLWFCTRDGLSRFDGYQFTNFGIEYGLPLGANDLVVTDRGWYWVATSDGVARFDTTGKGRLFTVYRPADPENRRITALADDGAGGLWCGTRKGLYRLRPSATTLQKSSWSFVFVDIGLRGSNFDDHAVTTLLRDRDGTVWVGSFNGLYRSSLDGQWKLYTNRLPHPHVTSVFQGRENYLWVGTWNGLCRVALGGSLPPLIDNTYDMKSGLIGQVVNALLESTDGTLWTGTDGGLSKLTWSNGVAKIENITEADGLSEKGVDDLAQDEAGNLWVAGAGVTKIIRGGFTRYGKVDGLESNWAISLFADQEGELCATTKDIDLKYGNRIHINCFDGKRFHSVLPNVPPRVKNWGFGSYQVSFQDRSGRWWIPTREGLFRFPPVSSASELARVLPEAVYDLRNGLSEQNVFRVFEDSRGDVWISTYSYEKNGLTVWQRAENRLRHYSQSDGLLPTHLAGAFREDLAGNIWIAFDTTLARVHEGRLEFVHLPQRTGSIRSLFLDREGRLWGGCARGLLRIDSPDSNLPEGILYGTQDGLSSDDVGDVTQDCWGRIYVSTGQGVDCFYPKTPLRVTHYTSSDGLANASGMVAFRSRDCALWFGNDQGLMRLDPAPEQAAAPPPVTIGEFKIRGVRHTLSVLGESEVTGLELPADQNQLEVSFVGLEFRTGKKLSYQYQLEGTDTDWSPAASDRAVNYASLSPGRYRFLVRAVNSEGLVSKRPATLGFVIVPPVWQREWMRFLMLLVIGAALYALYRYRLKHLLAVERVRARIAADLHDDIGSTLSQISILSEVASREVGDRGQVQSWREIADLSRESVGSMSDIVWAIDPEHDRLEELAHRMRRFASDLSSGNGVRIQLRLPLDEHDVQVGADTRRQIFLIFKEGLHNALRHSGCRQVEIDFRVEEGLLKLSIQDDGRGFDAKLAVPGHGLVSMQQRATSLGGDVEITSAPDTGTRVQVKIPLDPTRWRRWRKPRTNV